MKQTWTKLLGLILIGVSLLSLGWYLISKPLLNQKIKESGQQLVKEPYKKITVKKPSATKSTVRYLKRSDLQNVGKATKISTVYHLGNIKIPAINTELPIEAYPTYETMLVGASQLGPNQDGVETIGVGNYSLISHSTADNDHFDGVLFSSIKHLQIGDLITIEEADKTWVWSVTSNKIVSPSDTSVLENTVDPSLTLVSCINIKQNPDGGVYGASRTIVTAKLISKK